MYNLMTYSVNYDIRIKLLFYFPKPIFCNLKGDEFK